MPPRAPPARKKEFTRSGGYRQANRADGSTVCNNAVIFEPRSGTKIVASLHARLAAQGLARHLIPFEAGFAPSSSPCEEGRMYARRGLPISKQGRRFHRLPCEKPHNNSSIYHGGEEVNREEGKSVFFEALYKRKAAISCILRIVKWR